MLQIMNDKFRMAQPVALITDVQNNVSDTPDLATKIAEYFSPF
jgi:hypothetical protein